MRYSQSLFVLFCIFILVDLFFLRNKTPTVISNNVITFTSMMNECVCVHTFGTHEAHKRISSQVVYESYSNED